MGLQKASEEAAQCGLGTLWLSLTQAQGSAPVGPGARAMPSDFRGVRGQPHLAARDQGLRAPGGGLWNPPLQVSCSEGALGWEGHVAALPTAGPTGLTGSPAYCRVCRMAPARVMRFQQLK